jgi:hypothetical protein
VPKHQAVKIYKVHKGKALDVEMKLCTFSTPTKDGPLRLPGCGGGQKKFLLLLRI